MRDLKPSRRVAIGLALLSLTAFYVVTSPEARFEADDAFDYASIVEFGGLEDTIFPNHLLYLPLMKAIYEPVRAVLPEVRPLLPMVVVGSLLGASTVVLFYLLMVSWLQVPERLAIAGAGTFGASYGFWRYAAEAEVYSLATLTALLLLIHAFKLKANWLGVSIVSLLATTSVLAHSLNFALVLVVPLLLRQRGWRGSQILLAGALSGVLLVGTTYGAFEIARAKGVNSAVDSTYAGFYSSSRPGGATTPTAIASGLAALGSTIVGGNSLFSYEPVRQALANQFPQNAIEDEFVMGVTTPTWLQYVALLTMASALVSMAALLWRLRLARILSWRSGYILLAGLGAYLAILLFAGGLAQAQPEVLILLLMPFWAFVVGALGRIERGGWLLWVAAGTLVVNSFVSGFLPLYLGENRQKTLGAWLVEHAAPGDLVLLADSDGLARYLAYMSPAHAAHIGLDGEDVELVAELVEGGATTQEIVVALDDRERLSGYRPVVGPQGRLFFAADMFSPPRWLEAANSESAGALRALGTRVRDNFENVVGSDYYFVRATDTG